MTVEDASRRATDAAKACVVIPVYNHARTVGDVVRGALRYAATVLVCDDGSTDGSGDEAGKAGAILLRHATNQGKGMALRTLLEEAGRRGFRSAIALDADGQHLPEDIPKLAAVVAEEPGALVVGARDLVTAGAPGSSQFGRKFSNFWVWFEAGERVEDSQSGFRAYPLPETLQLRTHNRRYSFEVEVLLQAAWAGLSLRSVPIGVIYPKDRVSHFRPFADNVRISLLNTLTCLRLLLPLPLAPRLRQLPHRPGVSLFALRRWALLGGDGPLRRVLAAAVGLLPGLGAAAAPVTALACGVAALAGLGLLPALVAGLALRLLLERGGSPLLSAGGVLGAALVLGLLEARARPRQRAPSRWTGRSRGGVLGHWFFFQLTRWLGLRPAYGMLYPVALYFVVAAGAGRRASMQFLDRALGPTSGWGRWVRTYWHFLTFARTLLDRVVLAVHGKGAFHLEQNGQQHIRAAVAEGRGAVILTAHMGNWEVAAGVLGGRVGAQVAVVAYRGEQERLARYLEKAHGKGPRVIAVGAGDQMASLEMVRALRENTLVAVQGDRPVDPRVVRVPFLGREAPFPVGPFVLAAVSGAPLIATFSVRTGPASYRFLALPPMSVRFVHGQNRDAQLREWVEQYVRQLEALAREHPYQWFNFYDFWDAEPPAALRAEPPPSAVTPGVGGLG